MRRTCRWAVVGPSCLGRGVHTDLRLVRKGRGGGLQGNDCTPRVFFGGGEFPSYFTRRQRGG